jgi:hypothetical protein
MADPDPIPINEERPPPLSLEAFHIAKVECGANNFATIEPIVLYLDALAHELPNIAEQLRGLGEIVRLLHSRTQTRPAHRPEGTLQRWTDPNYLADWLICHRIHHWKIETGRKTIPAEERERIITETVNEAAGWHLAKRKKPTVSRVKDIMRLPKSRRLPSP